MLQTWSNGESGIAYESEYQNGREVVYSIVGYFDPKSGKELTGEALERHKALFIVPSELGLQQILDSEEEEAELERRGQVFE